jgi:hypothetical protein
MNLRDAGRSGKAFEVDEAVRRILVAWGKERDSEIGRMNLRRAADKLNDEQRRQLVERLAEISLGILCVVDDERR